MVIKKEDAKSQHEAILIQAHVKCLNNQQIIC